MLYRPGLNRSVAICNYFMQGIVKNRWWNGRKKGVGMNWLAWRGKGMVFGTWFQVHHGACFVNECKKDQCTVEEA